ncbi:hypothetical protein SmJEL517_g01958 [Synchytrium microbalum]|uniref:Mitochondrial inner membrane protease ATP23 n=1 Tax=Synchytrium microbalum TaxID=1806994 RepID=A0A507CCT4_9FUNG|nr:uncharacterized protein SmJEL517_g01958 [Synchytrium microbalum]TPX35734.1 hypothetical protein SmJEL517_g01958 [Synchytrium microbalum]
MAATPEEPTSAPPETDAAFTRWRNALSSLLTPSPSPLLKDETTDDPSKTAKDHERCEKWKEYLLKNSPVITFLHTSLPAPLTPSHFVCMPCPPTISGGFAPSIGIVLCQNRLVSQRHLEDTLAHELVHVYDHETTSVKWDSCEQYACSEIRAASLSGECRFMREVRRGFVGFNKGHQSCVKRRATLALSHVPQCQGVLAEDAVRNVWSRCFADTAPFDEIY